MKRIVVFYLDPGMIDSMPNELKNIKIKRWTPTIFNLIPPNSSISYILFWIAHYFRIFKNGSYCAYQIIEGNQTISSVVCVPPLFIWPFMKENDIQIKNVFTHPEFRGKGLAINLIEVVKKQCYLENRTFWYMTHDRNHASISLSKKAGFDFKGYYHKRKRRFLLISVGDIYDA